MEIRSSSLTFRISLIDIDLLLPHEEVIDSIVRKIADDMQSEGRVHDPLIVARDDLIILDGMHRYHSLKLLKCRFAPCCIVDYDSSHIKVGSWFRLYSVKKAELLAEQLLTGNRLDYSKRMMHRESIHCEPQTIILTVNGAEFSLPSTAEPLELAEAAVRLEKAMTKKGYTPDYLSEIAAIEQLKSGKTDLVISLPVFSKQQIRSYGIQRILLPHKVTRHIIPSRPLHVEVPLEMLKDTSVSPVEADRKLSELLNARRMERKPPGSVVDGRRYQEELLVFTA